MIVQFPSFYPDELVYSLLARYYMRSGYMRYVFVAEDLFQSKTVRPDIEFINTYTEAALRMITRQLSMEKVIEWHTMFPYYGRFLQKERRSKAFDALVKMRGKYHDLLPMQKRRTETGRCLRYCPVCVQEDRDQYGETYWHRIHQMQGISICPVHGCFLAASNVRISGNTSPVLIAAETAIPDRTGGPVFCDNHLEKELAMYMAEVFCSELDLQNDNTVGQFLHFKMEHTPYRSIRGEQRNMSLLHKDFMTYCKDLPDNHFTELWQIQKLLTDDRVNFYEICLLSMFLKIQVPNLVKMVIPKWSQEQKFDEMVFRLHEQGLKYPEIARRLHAPYDTVKAIGEGKYKVYRKERKVSSEIVSKAYDWKKIDEDTLPLVKKAIQQLQGDGITRPKKVSVYAVEKLLGLPSKRISNYLPLCKAEIEKYQETQEQYWAKEVIWAVQKIIRDGEPLNWKHVRNLTNIRKENLMDCLPYIAEVDAETMGQIKEIIFS